MTNPTKESEYPKDKLTHTSDCLVYDWRSSGNVCTCELAKRIDQLHAYADPLLDANAALQAEITQLK